MKFLLLVLGNITGQLLFELIINFKNKYTNNSNKTEDC